MTGQSRRIPVLVSFGALWIAQACFMSGRVWAGLALTLAGWAVLWRGGRETGIDGELSSRWQAVIALGLFVLSLAFRLYHLDSHPPFWWDEGVEAYDVRCLLAGQPLESLGSTNYHRAPLWLSLRYIAATVLGTTLEQMRIPSAVTGSITVVFVYFLGTRLFGSTAGILAGALLCYHPWLLHESRMMEGNILVPAMGVLLVLICRSVRIPLYWRAVLAGILAGVNLYGYAAGLHLPALAALALLIPWGNGEPLDRRLKAAVVALAIPAACLLPGFLLMPGYWDRAVSVSIMHNLTVVARNFIENAGIFNIHGDNNMNNQYPAGAPVLGLLLAPVFLLGVGRLAVADTRNTVLLFGWAFLAMLPGTVSADGARNTFRMVGVPPVMALVTALGGVALVHMMGKRRGWVLVGLLWTGEMCLDLRTYFMEYPADRATIGGFRVYAQEAGQELKRLAERGKLVICPRMTLAVFPVEKYYLFDEIRDGKAEFTGKSCTGTGKVARLFRDGYGNPQAILLDSGGGRYCYRTVIDLCMEGDGMQAFGNPAGALDLFRRWDRVMGGSAVLGERAGFAALRCGRYAVAEAFFRRVAGTDPITAGAWDGLAAALSRQGKLGEAKKALEQALRLSPGNAGFAGDLEMVAGMEKKP